ncbi:O-antigen ligase family protein [Chitinophaga arvensicola]|nr:O-antigen ligase family protein [Chitinophaga arvensicola]
MMYRTALKPMTGLVFMWFAIWLYPNALLYGTLPLNIRFDDIFVFFTFIVCIYKKAPDTKIWSLNTFRLALVWWLIHLLGNLNGLLYGGWSASQEVVKFLLKAAYVPMTVAIAASLLRSYADVRTFIKWLLIAGVATALLGVGTVVAPRAFGIFLIPNTDLSANEVLDNMEGVVELARRARGSIGTVATSVVCLFMSVLSLYLLTLRQQNFLGKKFLIFCFITILLGLAYTQSRGPLLAFAFTGAIILFRSENKIFLFGALMVAILVLVIDNPVRDLLFARFTGATGSTTEAGLDKRSEVWSMFLDKFDPVLLFNGIGMVMAKNIYKATAHNTYLGAVIYNGVWGVSLFFVIIVRSVKYSIKLMKQRNETLSEIFGNYLILSLVFMLIIGISIENFQNTICMQLFFLFMLICEKLINAGDAKTAYDKAARLKVLEAQLN